MLPNSVPLRQRLFLLVAAVALPILVCGSLALYLFAQQKREYLEASLVDTARAMSAAVDSELSAVVSAAQAITKSAAFEEERFERLYALAGRVKEDHASWLTVTLATPSGEQIFNLLRPFGDVLPNPRERATFAQAADRGRAVIGDLFDGRISGSPLFPVRVPVVREGETRYILSIGVKPEAMLDVVRRQKVPHEGVFAVIDGSGRIVARSRAHEQNLGKPITADLRQALERAEEGFAVLKTQEGRTTYAAYVRSAHTGWSVALGVPPEMVERPLRQALSLVGVGLALSVGLGILAAILIARKITRPVESLGRAAEAVGRGDPPVFPSEGIPELQQVAATLADALEKRRRAENEKERLLHSEREARCAAEEANRQKDQFLAMLGHELRNPLAALSNGIHLLLRDPPVEVVKNTHRMLGRQVGHLSHVTNDLLQVGRVISGKIELDRKPVDLSGVVESVLSSLQAAGRLKDREVSVHAMPVGVSADVHRLEQVLSNLLVNAVKYTRPGGRIAIHALRSGDEAELRIEDDGIGMEPQVVGRVFELFYQADRTMERSDGGLGLGLTLVRRLVELHGGEIRAESGGPGKGSRFIMRLPALDEAPSALSGPARKPVAPRSILVVEDNADARSSLVSLLALDGHRIHEAEDGLAGVACALKHEPDTAFIDLGLPGIDGYDCARRIRDALGTRIVLVALSGYGLEEHRRRALHAGFDLHLTKPAAPDAVLSVLAQRR